MAVVAVVKYTGGANDLVWRFPSKGLGTWTKLIVNESQEAVLYMGGQALDIFAPGQHELSTDNIPQLNKLVNLPAGARSPLETDIWYINKGRALEVKWGTPAPIEMLDSKYKTLIPLRAFGQFSIQVGDSTLFLNNFVETLPSLDNDSLIKHFRNIYLDRLKENMITYIAEKEISVFEISSHLEELSEQLKDDLAAILAERSVKLIDFRLNNIKLSEDSTVVKQVNDALAKKAVAELVGSEYVQELPLEIPTTVSNADLSGFDDMSGQEQDFKVPVIKTCPVCYNDLEEGVRYCRECKYDTMNGSPVTESSQVISETEDSLRAEPVLKKEAPAEPSPTMPNTSFELEKSAVKKCSQCGTQLRAKQKFCHKCGSKS